MPRLTREQEYAARWLRRTGGCLLRRAENAGVSEATLDAIVSAGLAERIDTGSEPVYKLRDTPPPPARPAPPLPPVPPALATRPFDRRILDLLSDGTARTGGEVAEALADSADFIARREVARETERYLAALRLARRVLRLTYAAGRNQAPLPHRYVHAEMVAPICLPCWYGNWSTDAQPPQLEGFPREICSLCGQRTNQAAWISRAEVDKVRNPVPPVA